MWVNVYQWSDKEDTWLLIANRGFKDAIQEIPFVDACVKYTLEDFYSIYKEKTTNVRAALFQNCGPPIFEPRREYSISKEGEVFIKEVAPVYDKPYLWGMDRDSDWRVITEGEHL